VSECTAARHTPTTHSYRCGCRCPETVATAKPIFKRWRDAARARGYARTRVRKPTDVDEVAVLRAIRGDVVPLTVAERGLAIDQLTHAGMSAAEIARRVGVCQRQVVRYRTGRVAAARVEAA
jgi:hypothetical protein